MAYLSRAFWQQPDERLQQPLGAGGVPGVDASGGAGGAGSPAVGSASAGAAPNNSGQGAPGALREFFAQNKGQGAALLGGLVDPLNSRIASESSRISSGMPTLPGSFNEKEPTPADFMRGGNPNDMRSQERAYNEAHAAWQARKDAAASGASSAADAAKAWSAQQVAGIQPIGQDVRLLGQGQEGMQTLLTQRAGANPYSGGQSRLDAWLAGSAANQNPGALQGVQGGWDALSGKAGTPGVAGSPGSSAPTWTSSPADKGIASWVQWFKQRGWEGH